MLCTHAIIPIILLLRAAVLHVPPRHENAGLGGQRGGRPEGRVLRGADGRAGPADGAIGAKAGQRGMEPFVGSGPRK